MGNPAKTLDLARSDVDLLEQVRAVIWHPDRPEHRIVLRHLPVELYERPRPDRALSAGVTHVASPDLVLDGIVAWSYDKVEWLPADPECSRSPTHGLSGLPTVFSAPDDLLPAVNIGTYPNCTSTASPARPSPTSTRSAATATWTPSGTHV